MPMTALRFVRSINAVWLFPTTYAIHLLEEYFVLGGFPRWVRQALAIQFSDGEFLAWNGFAFVLMCVGSWLVSHDSRFRFIEIALALAVLGNALAHLLGSVLTRTYSPGLITAVVVWVPLGWTRLQKAVPVCSARGRLAGTCIGLVVMLVTLVVLVLGSMVTR
jgi:hypothetical protein